MKTKKYRNNFLPFILLLTVLLIFPVNSCTDEFGEYNTNKREMMSVGPKQLSALFSNAIFRSLNWQTTDNYSRMSSTMANHLCGYISCGMYIQEQNNMNLGWHNTGWSRQFTNTIPTLQSILEITKDTNIPAYSIAMIYRVYVMQWLTDIWGPIPYTKAGSGEGKVPFESQKDVYYMMFEDLAKAISDLNSALQSDPALNVYGAGDMVYGGDVSKWIRFGNTLRLRMAIRISNIDPDKAKLEGEAAVAASAGGTMETNEHDALCPVTSWASTGNGLPRMESFFQDVMSTSMESFMVGWNDPRISEFWSPVALDPTMEGVGYLQEFKDQVGGYHGMTRGFETDWFTYVRAHSKYGPRFKDGNQLVTPINMMHAAEAWFLKAEGVWRGWNMGGGSAQSFYEQGITTSIKQWKGAAFPTGDINQYINSTATPIAPNNHPYYDPPASDIPVKFSTDANKQYEQILTQKWLALWPLSIEAFAEYRRTRLPKLYPKKYSLNANVNPALGQIVTRLPFVTGEINTQPDEIAKATELLGGPNLESTPVWWDVNTN